MIKQIACSIPLQILAHYSYKHIYLVCCLWLIIKESLVILVIRVFVDLNRIIEESV